MTAILLSDAAAQFGGTLLNSDAKCNRVSIDSRKVKRGDTVMLEAFGAGLAWGAVLLTY